MFCRLTAAHRLCSRLSCAGAARFTPPLFSSFQVSAQPAHTSLWAPLRRQRTFRSIHQSKCLLEQEVPEDEIHWKPVVATSEQPQHGSLLVDSNGEGRKLAPSHWATLSRFISISLRSNGRDTPEEVAQRALAPYREQASEYLATQMQDSTSHALTDTAIMDIMAGGLATSARQTLFLLDHFQDRLPFTVRADCCFHLRRTPRLWKEISESPAMFSSFSRQIEQLKIPKTWPEAFLSVRYMNLMVEFSSSPKACRVLADIEAKYPDMDDEHLLRITGHYTSLVEVDKALSALSRVSPEALQSPNPGCIGRCVNLLLLDKVRDSYSSHTFRILPKILELGVPPLEIIHNVVVQNTAKSRKLQVAFDLLYYLQTERINIHSHTYSKLLKHSFLLKDTASIDNLFTTFNANDDLKKNPWLMASTMNIVRSICYFEQKQMPGACVHRFIQIYDRAYSRKHLRKFGIHLQDLADNAEFEAKQPHPVVLAGTIWAYVLVQRDLAPVMNVWKHLTRLLETSDPQATLLVREVPSAFRAFLVFFTRPRHRSLDKALVVLNYVLVNHPAAMGEMEWAIVLAGFINAGGVEMAEKLRRIMRSTGRTFTMPGLDYLQERWSDIEIVKKLLDDVDVRGLQPRSVKDVEIAMGKEFGQASQTDDELAQDVQDPSEESELNAFTSI